MRFNKVYLEITNACNLKCSFCHGTSRAARLMTADEFDFLTDRLKGYTEYLYYHLLGEPLIHPQLPVFLKMARDKGYRSIVTTNGTLLEKCGEELLKTKALHKVNISLQSFEGNSNGDPLKYVRTCADFVRKASAEGVICVFRLWNINGADSLNEMIVSELNYCFPGTYSEARGGIRLDDRVYLEYAGIFSWPDIESDEISSSCYCYGLKDQLGILCDGTVVPCCLDADGVISLGNLFQDDLDTVLSSKRAEDMIEGFKSRKPSEELCRKCGYARRFDK